MQEHIRLWTLCSTRQQFGGLRSHCVFALSEESEDHSTTTAPPPQVRWPCKNRDVYRSKVREPCQNHAGGRGQRGSGFYSNKQEGVRKSQQKKVN